MSTPSCGGERRQRLVEVLAELKWPRARARAAELQHRLEQTYSKHRRLVEMARGRVHEIYERLQEGELQPPLPASPTLIAPPPLRPHLLRGGGYDDDGGDEKKIIVVQEMKCIERHLMAEWSKVFVVEMKDIYQLLVATL